MGNHDAPSVADVMTREVFAVGPGTSIESAARLLSQKRVSGAPVVLANGEVVGVVSTADLIDPDRDRGDAIGDSHYYLLDHGFAVEYGDPTIARKGTVAEIMTPSVLTILAEADLVEASHRMLSLGVHRMIVIDEARMLVGIVSAIDLLRGFASTSELTNST